MDDLEDRRVDLVAHLQRIAPIGKQSCALHQNTAAPAEPVNPVSQAKPFVGIRNIFVLVAVSARHDPPGQSAACEFGTKCANARQTCGAFGQNPRRIGIWLCTWG